MTRVKMTIIKPNGVESGHDGEIFYTKSCKVKKKRILATRRKWRERARERGGFGERQAQQG